MIRPIKRHTDPPTPANFEHPCFFIDSYREKLAAHTGKTDIEYLYYFLIYKSLKFELSINLKGEQIFLPKINFSKKKKFWTN